MEPVVPFGNLIPVVKGQQSLGQFFADTYARFKGYRFFGAYTFHKPSLVISDPDLIRYVMTKEFTHFHDRGVYCNEEVDPLSGHLVALTGSRWRNLRMKLTPTFTSGKMKKMFNIVKECGDDLGECLKDRVKAGEIVEIKDILARFATDVIASAAFGIKCDSLKIPENEFRYWGRKVFEPRPFRNTCAFFAPQIMDFFGIPFFDKGASDFFMKMFKETVSYRDANEITRNDFMDLLMQLMKKGYVDGDDGEAPPHISESTDGKISMVEGAAQAFVFFLGGFETSSSTATHCLYELAVNEDIQEKVYKDIEAGLEKCGGLTYESLKQMPYLHKVVSETLRKHPSIPMLNRVCTEAINLPTTNLHVPKGVDLVIPVMGIHNDPEIYPDPEKFDPERFNEENIANRHPYTYLPFGEGPRICIGIRFGMIITKIALISVLSRYRLRLGPDTPVPLKFEPGSVVLSVMGGMHLCIKAR